MSLGYIPPQPNPFTEQRVREELQRIDRLLDIRWQPGWVWNDAEKQLEGRYVLICYWPDGDRRYAGDHGGETYDILGAFCTDPADARSVPADPAEVLQLVLQRLNECDGERLPHTKRLAQISEHNRKQHERLKAEIVDEALELAEQARTGLYKPATIQAGIDLKES